MGTRTRTVAIGLVVVVALLAGPLVGTAAAWDGNDDWADDDSSGDDGRFGNHSEENRTVSGAVDVVRDTVDTASERTVESVDAVGISVDGTESESGGETTDRSESREETAALEVEVGDSRSVTDRKTGSNRLSAPVRLTVLARLPEADLRDVPVVLRPDSFDRRSPSVDPTSPDLESPESAAPVAPTAPAEMGPSVADESTGGSQDGLSREASRPDRTAADSEARPEADASEPAGSGSIGTTENSPTLIGSLAPFAGVPIPDAVLPVGALVVVVLLKPLASALSAAAAVLADWGGRLAVAFRFGNDGKDPLEHDLRARMKRWIENSPGITLTELSERSDASLSTVRHHARVLERERLVRSDKIRGNRRFFPHGVENEELVAALEDEMPGTIIEELRDCGTATVGDLVEAVDRSYSTVSYHLERLSEDGIVVQTKEGSTKVSQLAPWVRTSLDVDAGEAAADAGHEVGAD
ncbi:winged helix-turn-helix transcriptional regulator [Natronomonas marina]|jgi:predicted transcriptional regulator|uniref:winged helix-turn-helix transcriptional regulator n=1 Tax=Natronomonas marina TaxID=2961939 RepID=UPI0020C9866C|nr:winged helix-turn-helix transcriptional regulator [Natronomonas marina]